MKRIVGGGVLLVATAALAQEPGNADAVVVTATRVPQPSLEIPASIDRIYADEIRDGRPQVNLSESLGRVPGIVVQNRQNYPKALQIPSRGSGARATFGVRGIRLIADGIPATMPDGQGQASTFALGSAERIEVLRGPFSALYGNAAGGVIAVETADPPAKPTVDVDFSAGTYGSWRAGTRLGASEGPLGGLLDASRFESDGYREHSAVRRDHFNLKMQYALRPETSLTLVGNQLRQPETQDPLGLNRTQFEQNPRQVTPQALIFNTRKTVDQEQLGGTLRHRLDADSKLEATLYGGQRFVEQYLGFAGSAPPPTTSGGVVQLDRSYGGAALRYFRTLGDVRVSLGAEHERMTERRRGFVNNNGIAGELRRDEDDEVSSTDVYAQAEWKFAERWSAHGGLRASRVEFKATDHFIVPDNPDDSGARDYSATTPVAGLLFRASKTLSLYGNVGRGFETPTFAELAHQNPPATGLNFDLQASRSTHAEVGAKALLGRSTRVNVALFGIDTKDEVVVDVNRDGRTTFKNAEGTERRGVELGAETARGPFAAQFAYTYLDATFKESFSSTSFSGTGVPTTVTVPAGNSLPGVPKSQAYAQLRYRQPAFYTYVEALYRAKVPVNDVNSEFAGAYTVFNWVGGLTQQGSGWRISEYVRFDNLTDRNYAGSVIVNEGNRRFYEPSPRRSMTVGIQASVQF